jgi:hypothetical protein
VTSYRASLPPSDLALVEGVGMLEDAVSASFSIGFWATPSVPASVQSPKPAHVVAMEEA